MKNLLSLLSCALVFACIAIDISAAHKAPGKTELFPKNEVTYLTQYEKEVLCP